MKRFQKDAHDLQGQVSRAATWMMQSYSAHTHWWTHRVFLSQNPDRDPARPVFEVQTAQEVFQELVRRGLLVPAGEEGGEPVFLMRHDIDGWEKAVIDGRPIYGRWLKYRRTWPSALFGVVIGVAGSILVDQLKERFKDRPDKKSQGVVIRDRITT